MSKPLLCSPELFQIDLTGRVAIVTGANSGIGEVTARQLAQQGATVVIACRDETRGAQAAERIHREVSHAELEVLPLDLASLRSVRDFARLFREQHDRLDWLVNNAGVMNTKKGVTQDGFETQLGINHLGHFLLTELLLPSLKASAPSRVINLSSCFHDHAMGRPGELQFDDLFFQQRKYDGWKAYAQSKLANVLHARELAKRLEGTRVTAVSVHPGWVRTRLARHSMPLWLQNSVLRPLLRSLGQIEPWEGAQSTLHTALSPQVPHHAGSYFSQTGVYRDKSLNAGGWPLQSPNPEAHDDVKAKRLYEVSLELVGLQESALAAE